MTASRIPGFYKLSVKERRRLIEDALGAPFPNADLTWESGGLSSDRADQIVENVLGIYALPFGVALNALVNGEDRLLPMVVEEPSVIAACSHACKMVREGGGFRASMNEALMIGQIELRDVSDVDEAERKISEARKALLEEAATFLPGLEKRGGGPRDLQIRRIGERHLVVHLLIDCRDAMGANLVNTAAEGLGPRLAEITGSRLGLRILSNLSDRRTVTVSAEISNDALAPGGDNEGQLVAQAIQDASLFAERDPYRAATHNKGIMNGVDSLVIATGNDYRSVEAGAHAFAARTGRYLPLATWRKTEKGLAGTMELPLALGIVGGTLRVHEGARLALAVSRAKSASDLAVLAACAGLASNLAALRALSTEGIQRGHMSLHARSVAIAAGARGPEVAQVAQLIALSKDVTLTAAEKALKSLRKASLEPGRDT